MQRYAGEWRVKTSSARDWSGNFTVGPISDSRRRRRGEIFSTASHRGASDAVFRSAERRLARFAFYQAEKYLDYKTDMLTISLVFSLVFRDLLKIFGNFSLRLRKSRAKINGALIFREKIVHRQNKNTTVIRKRHHCETNTIFAFRGIQKLRPLRRRLAHVNGRITSAHTTYTDAFYNIISAITGIYASLHLCLFSDIIPLRRTTTAKLRVREHNIVIPIRTAWAESRGPFKSPPPPPSYSSSSFIRIV